MTEFTVVDIVTDNRVTEFTVDIFIDNTVTEFTVVNIEITE